MVRYQLWGKTGLCVVPYLFSVFINDCVGDIQNLGKGVQCGIYSFTSLLYADDLVIIADKGEDLQAMLDVQRWCYTWPILANQARSFISVTKGKAFSDSVSF